MVTAMPYLTPEEAELAYYEAFQAADLEAMMAVWSEANDIVCMHPLGGRQYHGNAQVLDAWLGVFAQELDIVITLVPVSRFRSGELAVHIGQEHIRRAEDTQVRGIVNVTNVFRQEGGGWKMVAHHASPGPRPDPGQTEQESAISQRVRPSDALH